MDLFIFKTWLASKLADDERGANLVEYVLLVVLIAVVAIAATTFIGESVSANYSATGSRLP